jgi:uncharacterized membrane protein (GlpM family)
MAEIPLSEQPERWDEIGKLLGLGVVDALARGNVGDAATAVIADGFGKLLALAFKLFTPIGVGLAKGIAESEDIVAPELARIAAAAVSDVFGRDVPASAFASAHDRAGRTSVAEALGAGLLETIKGDAGALQPGEQGARRFMGMVVNMALEGWYQGWFFEFLSSIVPYFDVGKIESFGELDDTLAQALGLGRLSNRVIGPLIDATVVRPFQWQTNKTYRPELLSPSLAVRQHLRGVMTREQLNEELARQGWSDDRIEALINDASRALPMDDAMELVRGGGWTPDDVVNNLKNQGFSTDTAWNMYNAERRKRIDSIQQRLAGPALSAYADGRMSEGDLHNLFLAITTDPHEREAWFNVANHLREFSKPSLSKVDVEEAVKRHILPKSYYREWLRQHGFADTEALALELLLDAEIRDVEDANRKRKAAEAERLREKTERDAETAKRKAALEARKLRGPTTLAQVEHAYVRGIVDQARVQDFLETEGYTPGDQAFLLMDLQQQRDAYTADQERRRAIEAREAARTVSPGVLRQATIRGFLSPDEYRAALEREQFDPEEVRLLVTLARAEIADRDAAERARLDAEERLRNRGVSLPQFEIAVRRGVRTLAEYRAFLAQHGFTPVATDTLTATLAAELEELAATARRREALERERRTTELSESQVRALVLRGVKTVDEYRAALGTLRYTPEDAAALAELLELEKADYDAALERRRQIEAETATTPLSLAQVERAVKVGIVTVADYRSYLEARRYSAADVETLVALLVDTLQEARAATAQRDQIGAELATRGLSLAQFEQAVLAGLRTIDDYAAFLFAHNYGRAAVELLAALLENKLAVRQDAARVRGQVAGELAGTPTTLDQFEQAVKTGVRSLDEYAAFLAEQGYDASAIALLVELLETPTTGA